MKALKIIVYCVFLISVTIFIGCSAKKQMRTNLALKSELSKYPVCVFSVVSQVSEDIDKELNELKSRIFEKVSKLNLFRSIQFSKDCEKSEGYLHVKVAISEIKKVSGAKRFSLGSFAGKAKMKADITFIDAEAQVIIGSYTITGKSGNTDFSGGTGDAIGKTSEAIVEIIHESY